MKARIFVFISIDNIINRPVLHIDSFDMFSLEIVTCTPRLHDVVTDVIKMADTSRSEL